MRVAAMLGLACGVMLCAVDPEASGHQPAATKVIEGAVPFTPYRATLLTVRFVPEAADPEKLIDPTMRQIQTEQTLWTRFGRTLEAQGPGRWLRKLFGQVSDKPDLIHEWPAFAERPGPLRDQLLSFYLDPEASAPGVADVFLFSRKQVEDREPRFAAHELVSVYKQHLNLAAAKAPSTLWLSLQLPPYTYDFQGKALRFSSKPPSRVAEDVEPADGLDILHRASDALALPARAQATANYSTFGAVRSMRQSDAAPTRPDSPTNTWRSAFVIGSSADTFPWVEVLAADRQLRLASLPIDLKVAERLVKTSADLRARVFLTAEGAELGTAKVERKLTRKFAVLFVRVQRIQVLGPDDELLKEIHGSSLPAPGKPSQQSPKSAGPATAAPSGASTQAADREVRERAAPTVEDLKRDSDAALKTANCKARAIEVNANEKSSAHRRAFAACMKEK